MKDLLNLILQNITTHPEDVKLLESEEDGRTVYTISVHPEDMGRVIGKSGKVIKAIRSLAHVIAIRKDEHYRINVAEVDEELEAGAVDEEAISAPEETAAPTNKSKKTVNESPSETVPTADDADLISGAIDVSEESK